VILTARRTTHLRSEEHPVIVFKETVALSIRVIRGPQINSYEQNVEFSVVLKEVLHRRAQEIVLYRMIIVDTNWLFKPHGRHHGQRAYINYRDWINNIEC
jgi:hypothetical protein